MHELDDYRYNSARDVLPDDAYASIHSRLIAGERWIIDGLDLKTMESRLARADGAILLDYSLHAYFLGVASRGLKRAMGRKSTLTTKVAQDRRYKWSPSWANVERLLRFRANEWRHIEAMVAASPHLRVLKVKSRRELRAAKIQDFLGFRPGEDTGTAPPQEMRLAAVSAILAALDAAGLEYVVLRNFEGVAEGTEKDIDLLARPDEFPAFKRLVGEACERFGGQTVTATDRLDGLQLVCAFPNRLDVRPIRVHISPFVPLHLSPFQRKVPGLSRRIRIGQVERTRLSAGRLEMWAPSPRWLLLLLLLRQLRKPKTAYAETCRALATTQACPDDLRADVLAAAAPGASVEALMRASALLMERLGPRRRRAAALLDWGVLALRAARARLRRDGLLVVFSGPDGAGKSTTTDACVRYLREELGLPVGRVKGLTVLAGGGIGRTMTRFQEKMRGVPEGLGVDQVQIQHRDRRPEGRALIWRMRRFVGLCAYIAQYYPAYLIARLYNHLGVTVVVDTSVHDRFVKAHRPRFKLLERLFAPSLGVGDVLLQLRADPAVIHARKPELDPAEIAAYYATMDELFAGRRAVRRVDSGRGIDRALADMKAIVLATLAGRRSEAG
jgi:hypothetical protein